MLLQQLAAPEVLGALLTGFVLGLTSLLLFRGKQRLNDTVQLGKEKVVDTITLQEIENLDKPGHVRAAVQAVQAEGDLGVDFSDWGEDELVGLNVESAVKLGMAQHNAERLVKAIADARKGDSSK